MSEQQQGQPQEPQGQVVPGPWQGGQPQHAGNGQEPGAGPNGQAAAAYDFAQLYQTPSEYDLAQVNQMSEPDAMIWYNHHGIPAYPAHPEKKMLLLPRGYHFDQLGVVGEQNLAQAHAAWQQYPGTRVAIVLGEAAGLAAIDVDHLGEWAQFCEEYGELLLPTAVQVTGREGGGLHLLFHRGNADPALLKQGPWSAQYPHIEVKSKGLIIAAPSLHASGHRYQWQLRSEPADICELIGGRMPLRIDCGFGDAPVVIRAVQEALNTGKIPSIYVTDGRAVIADEIPGPQVTADGSIPLPIQVTEANAPGLASVLANHTNTFKWIMVGKGDDAERVEREFTPASTILTAALAPRSWPGLKPLNGIVGAPVLRPDGTLLQEPGYDKATGLHLASRVRTTHVPAAPPAEAVTWAKNLLLKQVLADFPWCGPADKANYVAMLATQVLRRYLRGAPVPFFPVTAASPGSGKTLLITICGALYGQAKLVWTGDDEELRKTLTTVLADQAGVIAFDNLPAGTVLRSPVLSKLLTDRTWGDRLLGGNVLARFANDRLWAATGNNLRVGGDMSSRVVLICIDPRMPHPERRSGFAIPDLEAWIEEPASQQDLLTAVLVLVADWAAAGCQLASVVPMRQFTKWAQVCGGLLAHHRVDGFLANAGELEDMDDDEADWAQFFARWMAVLGGGWLSSEQVLSRRYDPGWGDTFPSGREGLPLSAKSLGRRLSGEVNRYHGAYVLRGWRDAHSKTRLWRVETWQPTA